MRINRERTAGHRLREAGPRQHGELPAIPCGIRLRINPERPQATPSREDKRGRELTRIVIGHSRTRDFGSTPFAAR